MTEIDLIFILTGLEGLTYDPDTHTLYALLQSGTVQDGAGNFTRLLAYDVHDAQNRRPTLCGEWVVQLPTSSSGSTFAGSEVHFVSDKLFLALSRDGNGRGGSSVTSAYKYGVSCCRPSCQFRDLLWTVFDRQADLVDISAATDIHGTRFDEPTNPIVAGGVLNSAIKSAKYVPFVNYLNTTQLAKFGLHNGALVRS
jgi:hypothetical protein